MLQVAIALVLVGVQAPEAVIGRTKPAAEASREPARVLTRGEVDFWGTGRKRPIPANLPKTPQETIWAEPVRMPDGRFALYLPPAQVVRFLDDPNPTTALDYVAWQRERFSKLRRAMEVLQELAVEEEPPKNGDAPKIGSSKSKAVGPAIDPPRIELLYFKKPGCPYCDTQDTVLAALKKSHPGIALLEVSRDKSPQLWEKHSVTVTPTIVVTSDTTPVVTFRGLASLERLEETIRKAVAHAGE